jgi:hypothetical protein
MKYSSVEEMIKGKRMILEQGGTSDKEGTEIIGVGDEGIA